MGQVGFTANCNPTRYFLGKNPTQPVYLGLRFGGNQVLALQKNRPTAAFFPGVFKTTVIEKPILALFETASIGNPITTAQNRRFNNHCNRRPIATVSRNASIGSPIAAFYNRRYRLGLSFFF